MTVHLDNFDRLAQATAVAHPVPSTTASGRFYRTYGKRAFDIVFTLMVAPLVIVLVAGIALVLKARGISPFFSQPRVGLDGQVFQLRKLRTMVPDAEAALAAHLAADPAARAEWDATQKLKNDPRITPCGAFCRKTSLDELPQFWNVLRGEMSLIGPRPMMPDQRALYPGTDYYALRPGITGPWQVSDRNHSTFADRARFDAEYNRVLSFRGDLVIMLRTIAVVFRATGY